MADEDSALGGFEDYDSSAMDGGMFDGPGGAPQQEKLLDADFFNAFPDDFDESDMALS